jgi:phage gpG-like protein
MFDVNNGEVMTGPFGFTSYEVLNDEKMSSALRRAASVSNDLKIPFSQIAKDFQKSRKAIFALSSAGQYPDLSTKPFYAWWEKDDNLQRQYDGGYKEYKKAKYGFSYPILKATGRLERSVTDASDPENVTSIGPLELKMGTRTPYAVYHQSDLPRSRLPLRKFLFVGPESKKFANSEISGFPERALNTLNSYILRSLGLSVEQATGKAPVIKKGKK